ncbi:MAG: 3-dehydro-L-gulonate 2-dehydrogenase [Acidobacteriota bacterium]|nr:3-dehydro-L-gulonate 2-dehydrogenase [Acidobacteriota bacterium]
MLRIPYNDLYAALERAMQHLGLQGERAGLCARLFADTTCDGVYTHGLDRFPRFAEMVANGCIDVNAEPTRVVGTGALERWDGHLGPGNLNAHTAMQRAIALAGQHGLGGVALANTNHWMRGGSYGWLAADAGDFALCWTNTLANLPPWGASTPAVGNNPLVIAVPRPDGAHVVLDMAMSQFSYGALSAYSARGQQLPVPGGYDQAGNLTTDPAAIEASKRALAVGYWKGSGLSLVLDMLAAMLAGGNATHDIPQEPTRESGVSQIFLAIDPSGLAARAELDRIADGIVESLREATPINPDKPVRYPGEQTLHLREENQRLGVPVTPEIWQKLNALAF